MSALLMIALVSVVFVGGVIAFNMGVGYKMILVGAVLIIGGFGLYVSHECGPNSADVKVMKPMAEKIADYIVKNGIPKSLEDIPGLPYELEGCSKPQGNVEDCTFFIKEVRHDLRLYELVEGLSIKIKNRDTKTGVYVGLRRNNKESQWFFIKEKSFSSKRSGVCNPMKQ